MKTQKKKMSTQTLVMCAMLTALVVVLQLVAEFVKGPWPVALSFVLLPIVIGAATGGWKVGTWLGFVFAVVTFCCPSTQPFYAVSVPGTILIVLAKSMCAGYVSSVVYKALCNKNQMLAIFVTAIVAPIVNTGIFLIGCATIFAPLFGVGGVEAAKTAIILFAGVNFLFELISNVILSPVVDRLLKIRNR